MPPQDAGERVHAAASLATHLKEGEVDQAYAVKRLVRGLCSSRGGARQGFAAGLTLILHETSEESLALSDILQVVLKETATTAGMRGAEERDLLLGRLFGLGACARSGRSLSLDTMSELTDRTLDLFEKRKWMHEACITVFRDILVNHDDLGVEEALAKMAKLIGPDPLQYRADELALALVVEEKLRYLAASDEEAAGRLFKLFPKSLRPPKK